MKKVNAQEGKLSKNYLLKRLLGAVWYVVPTNTAEPTPSGLLKRLKTSPGFDQLAIDIDNVSSYFGSTKTSVPQGAKEQQFLKHVNVLLFGTHVEKYVAHLETAWTDVAVPEHVRENVNRYFRNRDARDASEINHVLLAPDYLHLDPANIDVMAGRDLLDAHLLYHSPTVPHLWDRVKDSDQYRPLYRACEDGLKEILDGEQWSERAKDIELVFNLGVGSPLKDRLILESLKKWSVATPTYVWVDASLNMLTNTIKHITTAHIGKVRPAALQVDFENTSRLKSLYADAFPDHAPFTTRKAFVILGFTLCNLNEEKFLKSYAKACSDGDVLVFPMHFIPPEAEDPVVLEKFKANLKQGYVFEEGIELSKEGLSILRNYDVKDTGHADTFPHQFDGKNRSVRIEFTVLLKEKKPNPRRPPAEREVTTARSARHFRSDYEAFLNKVGFRIVKETQPRNGVTTLLVEKFNPNSEKA